MCIPEKGFATLHVWGEEEKWYVSLCDRDREKWYVSLCDRDREKWYEST